ncbi:MAG TPA: FtsQ-type POTRA domain-containing protein [Anaerolineales bacterium]|nr:FtsQ-type POTRA domain-containing protein [Anaerolineales bacterium]
MTDKTTTSRSDSIRARREQRERGKQTRAGKAPLVKSPPAPPAGKTARDAPVMIRGARADIPVRHKKSPRVRRRFDIALGAPGAEVQLPAMPFVRPSWRWLSATIAAGLVALLGLFWSHPVFMIGTIEVEGLQRLEAREVHLVIGLRDVPIFTVDPAVMEHDLLLAFPEFAAVEVRVGLPNRVMIRVEERQPVLGWRNEQGLVLVDEAGVSFPARGLVNEAGEDTAAGGSRLPIVEAPDLIMDVTGDEAPAQDLNPYIGRQLLTPDLVAAILTVTQKAPANAAILYDPDHGIGWLDPAGWVVYFGTDGRDIGAKLEMYAAIVLDLTARGIRPGMISVEFLHAPYYRMERE